MIRKIQFARKLRARSTDAERALWRRLRAQQISGAKFRRQAPIGQYIVDFVSFNARIIIELDGGQHAAFPQHQRDEIRDRWLEEEGFLILRFWNTDVLLHIEGVFSVILDAIHKRRSR
jgi:very-short-patch-repair endonuclease